jgi:hypothetical protein
VKPRLTSFAPQFLVDDLDRSIAHYRKLGFTFENRGTASTPSVISTVSKCT